MLAQRRLGFRPVTLVGYSLGARVIFYALQELAAQKAHGIVQDVFLLGATVTASTNSWREVRSIVSGRFVNGFATNDWVLNYLFRATTGGLNTVAGLRPIENVLGLENIDVTHQISGHMSYRTFMPLILRQLNFPVTADHFDDPQVRSFERSAVVTIC
jgi:pimeloyl-ACP methyl ester carboxylesterase